MICPICKGSGRLLEPLTPKTKKEAIITLYKAGFTQRHIQRLLGYKSPRSVNIIIKHLNNK